MKKIFLFLSVVAVLVGCSYLWYRAPTGGNVPTACRPSDEGIAVATYNVGLAPGIVDLSTPRVSSVVEGIADVDFDILCVQEAWERSTKEAILDRLYRDDPQHLRYLATETSGEGETGEDRCQPHDFAFMDDCMRDNCAGIVPEQVSLCALDHCKGRGVMLYMSARKCLNCLIANAGRSMDEAKADCVDGAGASRLYHGQNGNILVARHPMRNRETLRLRASGANRVALFATIDVRGQEVEVACTHLSSKTYVSPTHPDFSTWEDEQRTQLEDIDARLAERADGRPRILVGDLNIGRKNGSFLGDHMRSVWDRAVTLSYVSPADAAADPFCTSCADNALRHKTSNYLIDHVMLYREDGRLPFAPLCVERLLDDTVTVIGYDGASVATRRSDHYALRVVFDPTPEPHP